MLVNPKLPALTQKLLHGWTSFVSAAIITCLSSMLVNPKLPALTQKLLHVWTSFVSAAIITLIALELDL